jgi:uncharacterized protein YbaP (TraB family)
VRRWLATLAAALLLAPPLAARAACPPVAVAPDAATLQRWAAQASDHGLLWRYEKDGRAGWLFGTIHVGRGEWTVPGPALARAVAGADRLVLEVDPLSPTFGDDLQQAAAPAGAASVPRLSDDLLRRLARQRELACVGHALDGLPPALQAVSLLTLIARPAGLDPAWGQEPALSALFHGQGRPVESIETPGEQLDALLGPDDPSQTLAQALAELEDGSSLAVLQRLAQAWAAGDREQLARYPEWCRCLDTAEQRALNERVVAQRNRRMGEAVMALHARGARPLVAVGALHMIGPDGLPALLHKAGFTVTWLGPAPRGAGATAPSR